MKLEKFQGVYCMKAQLIRTYKGHTQRINSMVTLSNRFIVTAGEDNHLKVWDIDSDESHLTLSGHQAPITALASFPESSFVVSASQDRTLMIWNIETGESVRTLEGHTDAVTAVSVTPDGKTIVSGSDDRTVRMWSTHTGECLYRCNHHRTGVHALAITPDSQFAIAGEVGIAGNGGSSFRVWDIQSGEHIRDFEEIHHGVVSIAMLSDQRVISSSTEGDLVLWEINDGKSTRTIETHMGSAVMAVFPNERYAVIGTQKPQLTLWNIENGEHVYTLDQPSDWVSTLMVTPDGRRVLAGCHDGTLNVYELN
jgi:WD40 repeat protein